MIRATVQRCLLSGLLGLLLASAADAAMYKCKNSDGSFSYGDQPCTGTAKEQSTSVKAAPAPQVKPAPASGAPSAKRSSNGDVCAQTFAEEQRIDEAEQEIDALYQSKKISYADYQQAKREAQAERRKQVKTRQIQNCSGN